MLDTYSSLHLLVSRDDTNQTSSDSGQDENPYGYKPTFSICILFLVLFGGTTFLHFCQAIYHRKWFFLYTVVFAGLIELGGWYGRLWSTKNVFNNNAFTIQIVCTIVGPTPLLAANFIILARIIRKLGERYSRLRPRLYSRIFLSCDIVALFVQAGGGSLPSGSSSQNLINIGSDIMLGGIAFQLFVIVCYMVLATEFFWRCSRDRPVRRADKTTYYHRRARIDDRLKLLVYALVFNTTCLLIRSIYRTIELADGFDGKVFHTQWLFNLFDATVVVLAMYAYNVAHIGRLLNENDSNGHVGTSGSDHMRMESIPNNHPTSKLQV